MNKALERAAFALRHLMAEADVDGAVTIDIRVSDNDQKYKLVNKLCQDLSIYDLPTAQEWGSARTDRFAFCGFRFRVMTRIGDEQ